MTRRPEGNPLRVIEHNLAVHKLTAMRDHTTSSHRFRRLVHQMGLLLCAEMTRDIELLEIEQPITTPMGHPFVGKRRDQTELVVMPVLRAGLPLGEAFLELLPRARVGHVGIYRDESNDHHCYMLSLPRAPGTMFFVLDVQITQGQTPAMAVDYLLKAGVRPEHIRFGCLIASKEGVEYFYKSKKRREVKIYTFCNDDKLDEENGFLKPGVGNVGGRLFGTGEP